MLVNLAESLILISAVVLSTQAAVDPKLTGTWSTKSRQVITGPVSVKFSINGYLLGKDNVSNLYLCVQGFYNPSTDRLIEPSLTGISYSFTDDGFYEEAYYRAVSNRELPESCLGTIQSNEESL